MNFFSLIVGQALMPPALLELPNGEDSRISIETVVQVKELEPEQRYVLREAAKLAVQYTAKYGKKDMENLLSPGYGFRVNLSGDFLRIGFTVDKETLGTGLSMIHSILTSPSFFAESIKPATWQPSTIWNRAYEVSPIKPCLVEVNEMRTIWNAVVHRDSVKIGVRGPFSSGQASRFWNQYGDGWQSSIDRRLPKPRAVVVPKPQTSDTHLALFESPVLKFTEPQFAEAVLAATLMGTAKECILWRVSRETLQLSYRQESFLVSERNGWRFRIAVATDEAGVKDESISKLKTSLAKAISELSTREIVWAKGAAKGYLRYQMPTLPLVTGVGGLLDQSPEDQLYLELMWRLKFGSSWNPENFLKQVDAVPIERVKAVLADLLELSSFRIVDK